MRRFYLLAMLCLLALLLTACGGATISEDDTIDLATQAQANPTNEIASLEIDGINSSTDRNNPQIITDTTPTIAWATVANAKRYKVILSCDNGYRENKRLSKNITTYSAQNTLELNTVCSYKVRSKVARQWSNLGEGKYYFKVVAQYIPILAPVYVDPVNNELAWDTIQTSAKNNEELDITVVINPSNNSNLLPNGSMESIKDGKPTLWRFDTSNDSDDPCGMDGSYSSEAIDDGSQNGGSEAVRLTNGACIDTSVSIPEWLIGQTVSYSCDVKLNSAAVGMFPASMKIWVENEVNGVLEGTIQKENIAGSSINVNDFKRISLNFTVPNTNLSVALEASTDNEVIFDSCKLIAAYADTPLCEFGGFNDGTLQALEGAGIHTIGYVATGATARPLAEVKQNIDRYHTCPNLEGIFFDEVQLNDDADLEYYTSVCQHAKDAGYSKLVLNPGIGTPVLPTDLACGITVVSEVTSDTWQDTGTDGEFIDASFNNFSNLESAALIHTSSLDALSTDIELACTRGVDYLFATDDPSTPNPWDWNQTDSFTFWDELVKNTYCPL